MGLRVCYTTKLQAPEMPVTTFRFRKPPLGLMKHLQKWKLGTALADTQAYITYVGPFSVKIFCSQCADEYAEEV